MRVEAKRGVWDAGLEGVDVDGLVGPTGLMDVRDDPDLNAKAIPNWLPSNKAVNR